MNVFKKNSSLFACQDYRHCLFSFLLIKLNMDFEKIRQKDYSPEFVEILKTVNEPCDLKSPKDPPGWLDMDLFKQGLSFLWKYFFVIAFSSFQSLVIGISIPSLWYIKKYYIYINHVLSILSFKLSTCLDKEK